MVGTNAVREALAAEFDRTKQPPNSMIIDMQQDIIECLGFEKVLRNFLNVSCQYLNVYIRKLFSIFGSSPIFYLTFWKLWFPCICLIGTWDQIHDKDNSICPGVRSTNAAFCSRCSSMLYWGMNNMAWEGRVKRYCRQQHAPWWFSLFFLIPSCQWK